MTFKNSNDYLDGRKSTVFPAGSEVVAVRFAHQMDTTDLQLNDIGAVGILPAGCVPVALLVDSDDLDTGTPALALSVGVLNAAGTDLSTAAGDGGAAWGTGITVAQAGGQVQVLGKALSRVASASIDRTIGVKVTTAAGTAAAGELGLTLLYRAA